jgi:ribose 5-phosphate isomerase A
VLIAVDESKRVKRLGTRGPLPVEVEPFGAHTHPAFFASLGAEARFRTDENGGLRLTDGGNYIVDLYFPGGIEDPEALDLRINRRPGIIENGLFIHLADHVLTASPSGVDVDSLGDVSL